MSTRCIRCGTPLEGTAQYCADCAAQLEQESARWRTSSPATAAQRPGQTATLPRTASNCPSCGQVVPAGATFCPNCGTAAAVGGVTYAGFWMRLVAWLIDGIIIGIPQAVVSLLVSDPAASLGIQALIGFIYHIAFWTLQGATPGLMAMGVKITMTDGRPITGGAAVVRYLGYILCILTLGIGFLMIGWTRQKRGLHDYLAGTVAVKTR